MTGKTTNFSFQKIGDGIISATGGQTAVDGSLTAGVAELQPGDYNALLTAIDTNLPAPVTGLSNIGGTVAATGSAQNDAVAINARVVAVTAANATKGAILPAATAGAVIFLKNTAAAVLKVYPAGTDVINALSASAAISMAASTSACFFCPVAGTWYTLPLLPS